jgi:aminoglycoside phosphotransferase (APT) family kinase protein
LLLDRVVALLRDPFDVELAKFIFGTADPLAITLRVQSFCLDQLGAGIASCQEFGQSVGAVFVLELESGVRVVLKFYSLGDGRLGTAGSLPALTAVYRVQTQLRELSVPCAAVIQAPVASEGGAVAAMAYLDGTGADDARDAGVRRAMAEMLAEIARVALPLRDTPMLPVWRLPDGLWPVPHNVLFDLATPGGEWIDERARRARAVLDASSAPPILLHTDFSAANVRVRDGRVCAIYDMDSVALVDEMRGLAGAAVHHTYTGAGREPATSREQARAFVVDYEVARGKAFTRLERRRLDASAVYAMAYTARCEHSGDPSGGHIEGSMRALLREAPPTGYFD